MPRLQCPSRLTLEREYTHLDDIPAVESTVMGDEQARSAMAGYPDLVAKVRREIYKVKEQRRPRVRRGAPHEWSSHEPEQSALGKG